MMQKMVVLVVFLGVFNCVCSIIVVSIIELTALDGLIFGLCVSKYGFVCIYVNL